MEIFKIVLTGGPCAGKTEVINGIKEKLEDDGYYVVVVPETASELIRNGIIPNDDRLHTLKFQELILLMQSQKEKTAEDYCESIKDSNLDFVSGKKGIVILYDRAIMDNRAYLSHEDYNNMLKKYNFNEISMIDKYDLAINLVSLANTNPELYKLDDVRYETIEEAAYKDLLTSGAWLLHRNLKVIKPTNLIEQKIDIVYNYINQLLENRQKSSLQEFEIDEESVDYSIYNNNNSRKIKIKSIYLHSFNNTSFVLHKRQYNGYISFVMEKKKSVCGNILTIESKPIPYEDYNELLATNIVNNVLESEVLHYINCGNYFVFVENDFGIKLLTNNSITEIPNNIVLKKTKNFNSIQ